MVSEATWSSIPESTISSSSNRGKHTSAWQGKEEDFQSHGGREKLQVSSRSTCVESSYGYRGKEATTQQEKCAKAERETKNGGNREGETLEGTRFMQTGEGNATETGTVGGATCANRWNNTCTSSGLIRTAGIKQIGWTIAGAGLRSWDRTSTSTVGYGYGTTGIGTRHWPYASPLRGRLTCFTATRWWASLKWSRRHWDPRRLARRRDAQHLIQQIST